MLAVLVNTLAVLLGSTVGLLARKGIPEKVSGAIMTAISLCTLYAGVSGMLKGENTLVLIVSMVLGTAAGTLLDLDGALARLGKAIESRFRRTDGKTSVAEGFVTASLLFCIGAMAIVGSIQDGILGDHATLFAKAVLDLVIIIMVPCTVSDPFSTRSICESAPEIPTNSTLTPMVLISVFCSCSGMRRPPSSPARPPATIAAALTIVPSPCICASPFCLVSSQYSTGFRPLQAKKEVRSRPFVCYI